MTNAEQVKELCRQMRGIALNYPDGLKVLRAQLDALEPAPKDESTLRFEQPKLVAKWEPPAVTGAVVGSAQVTLEATKRRPGRPKGSKNRSAQ